MAKSILIPSNSRGLGVRANEMSNVSPLISRSNLQKKSLILWYRKIRYLHSTICERTHNPNFNSLEFEGIINQVGLNRFVLSEKLIAKQAAAQLVQIPWRQNITKNLPDEFRSSLPSIEEIEAELSGAEELQ